LGKNSGPVKMKVNNPIKAKITTSQYTAKMIVLIFEDAE
jgi:hypothetical protein